jgi:uncharacterized membrane protein
MSELFPLKLFHILGAVLLIGNVLVTGLWAALLWHERSTLPYARVARIILWADLAFTVIGGTVLTITGILLVIRGGYDWRTIPWLRHGIFALAAGTGIWLALLLPDQWRLVRWNEGHPRYRSVYLRWTVVGWATTLVLLFGLWAMVSKS